MPTKPTGNGLLTGQALADASLPLAQTPRGGMESGFAGITNSGIRKKRRRLDPDNPMLDPRLPDDESEQEPNGADEIAEDETQQEPVEEQNEFAGMGPWLEAEANVVFDTAHNLVLRQELLALNHWAVDSHFARLKLGQGLYSTLTKDETRSIWKHELAAGSEKLQAVPNKSWDLCNKATETILVDFAQPTPYALDVSEAAQACAKLAQRFLDMNGGEQGQNDIRLFFNAVDRALVGASSYIEKWIDPVGGGYVPLQILAHPQAENPDQPLIGPDGMPTTDPILRYVTAPEGGQFTEEPEQAAPQWQPKIRNTIWNREHIRVFPEDVPVDDAEKVILLGYCTIADAKRRWRAVAEMDQAQINTLCDWTPPRYLVLLPPFQQARWKISAAADKEKQGASDERLMFYYRVYAKASPENKRGADVVISGAAGGTFLHKNVMAAVVEVDDEKDGKRNEVRCLDIPITQVTPRSDPDGRDPSGLCFLWLFAGAVEFDAALMTAFLEMVSLWVHPDSYMPSTSVVQDYQITESRMTGQPIPILRPEDKPVYGNQPVLPNAFWQSIEHNASSIESIASMTKPLTGSDRQPEVSGKARQIAVQQAMVGLSRMQHPVNAARARDARIALQLAMRDFSTSQIVRYVGEDGAWQAQEWTGKDFAMIGGVSIKAGTGTMMAPEAKVNYLGNLQNAGLLSPEEAREAARPAYATTLGLKDSAHDQHIERCIGEWLKGPPEGWVELWQQHQQELEQYKASVEPMMQQAQAQAAQAAQQGIDIPPLPPPPEPPKPPWTPFMSRPNDNEMSIASSWARKLSIVISSVKYAAMPPEWREPLDTKYGMAVKAATPPPPPETGKPGPKPQGAPNVQ